MSKITILVKKTMPYAKKAIGPAIMGMISGVTEAMTKHKAEMRLQDIESRIADVEKLVKKD